MSARFSTYVTQDMVAASGADSLGEYVRFTAAFGGVRNDAASVRITFLPAGVDSMEAGARFDRAIHVLDPSEIAPVVPPHHWAVSEFRISRAGDAGSNRGWVALARHGARWFFVIQSHPAEYSEGMGPRVEALWREWRWEDTGEGL